MTQMSCCNPVFKKKKKKSQFNLSRKSCVPFPPTKNIRGDASDRVQSYLQQLVFFINGTASSEYPTDILCTEKLIKLQACNPKKNILQ